ncbi:hypothetical protein [Streptomyces sp. NPDC056660]|uniref:hypothetical protein n=1 Tax=Streptomyces sp. NPDC056660 TaxID=3345897 RepID=UPI0036B52DB4
MGRERLEEAGRLVAVRAPGPGPDECALPAFRVAQFPVGVRWTGWMRYLLDEILGGDLEARLLWSPEPSAAPHPDPWGL